MCILGGMTPLNSPSDRTEPPSVDGIQIGRIFKAARTSLGLDLAAVGERCGYSASTVSRWETGKRRWTVEDLTTVAKVLEVPLTRIGLAASAGESLAGAVARRASVGNDGPMRRRTLIAASLSAVSAATLGASSAAASGIENALFASTGDAEPQSLRLLAGRVSAVEGDLSGAQLAELDRRLPGVLRTSRATWAAASESEAEIAASLLSRVLSVTAQQQIRLSRETLASVAADRAERYAELAGDPVAAAEASRNQATVLRRTGSPVADQIMVTAAERLRETTGLTEANSAGMYAKLLASAAYTCAGKDDRDSASEYLEAARRTLAPYTATPHIAMSDLDVYVVSCDRVLGDHGAALHHAQAVNIANVPDVHERGRYWQEVSISAYGRGRIDLAIDALAELDATAPQYLHHRPWSRDLVEDLLHTATGGNSALLQRLARQAETS